MRGAVRCCCCPPAHLGSSCLQLLVHTHPNPSTLQAMSTPWQAAMRRCWWRSRPSLTAALTCSPALAPRAASTDLRTILVGLLWGCQLMQRTRCWMLASLELHVHMACAQRATSWPPSVHDCPFTHANAAVLGPDCAAAAGGTPHCTLRPACRLHLRVHSGECFTLSGALTRAARCQAERGGAAARR